MELCDHEEEEEEEEDDDEEEDIDGKFQKWLILGPSLRCVQVIFAFPTGYRLQNSKSTCIFTFQ